MKITTALLRPTGIITLAFAVLLALNGVWALGRMGNLDKSMDHAWDYGALANVPEKARARRNPLEGDTDAPAAGRKLYGEHCAECHGLLGEGGERGPSLRANEVQQAAPGGLFWILTNGVVRRGMPVWSKLPEPERWQVVTYLKSLGTSPEREGGRLHD